MKVFILAGGLGTRIRALFPDTPKSLIPFHGKPFLEYQMALMARQGFTDFILCVGHRAEQIRAYFGSGERWHWRIAYSHEATPLGTGGALRYAAAFFQEAIFVLNGDTYLEMDYRAMAQAHAAKDDAIGTLAIATMPDTSRYGQVVNNRDDQITAFLEKQQSQGPGNVNAGVYIFEPRLLPYIAKEQKVSLEKDVFPKLLAAGEALYTYIVSQPFVDIGTPQGYQTLKDILR